MVTSNLYREQQRVIAYRLVLVARFSRKLAWFLVGLAFGALSDHIQVYVYSHHWLSDIPACRFVWVTPDFANVSALVQTALRKRALYSLPLGARESLSTMTNRTKQSTVHFTHAFEIPGFDRLQPAGEYRVDHDEERIEGVSRQAWRRVGTFIHLPAIASKASTHQMVPINPADLDAALEKDHQQL